MPTRYTKQVIISVQDTDINSFVNAKKHSFEQHNEIGSCVILMLPLTTEQLTQCLADFSVHDTDMLRVIVAGHGAPGHAFIAQLTENKQKIAKQFSADDIANTIQDVFQVIGRPTQLPFTLSIAGCHTGSNAYSMLGLIKYPSFAKALQQALYAKEIYPEITAITTDLMLQWESKSKYTSYKPGSDLQQDQLILAELTWLRERGTLQGISDEYWSEVQDSFKQFLVLNAAVVRSLEAYNATRYIWQVFPFNYFFPQYTEHCKQVKGALDEATQNFLAFQQNCRYKDAIRRLAQFTSFCVRSQPNSKLLLSYTVVDGSLVSVDFDDAYGEPAIQARSDYRKMMLLFNNRALNEDPNLTPESIALERKHRQEVRLWGLEQKRIKFSRCADIEADQECGEESFFTAKPVFALT